MVSTRVMCIDTAVINAFHLQCLLLYVTSPLLLPPSANIVRRKRLPIFAPVGLGDGYSA